MSNPQELRERALALNDSIVQGLAAAKMALELGDHAHAARVIDQTLAKAQGMIGDLLRAMGVDLQPGDLVSGGPPLPQEGVADGDSRRT